MTTLLPLFKVVINEEFCKREIKENISQINSVCSASGSTPLHYAMIGGNKRTVQFLILHGSKLNSQNLYSETPLHWACKVEKLELVKLLLKAGVCTNIQDSEGNTPLHWAADVENPEIVEILLKYCTNPNQVNHKNQSPFEIALFNDYQAHMKLLNPAKNQKIVKK